MSFLTINDQRPTTKAGIYLRIGGFTFLELLISIAIIGIIATISMVALRNQSTRARDARRIADLEQMRTALEFHRKRFGNYPSTEGLGHRWGTTGPGWRGECGPYRDPNVASEGFIPDIVPEFMSSLPRDPRTSQPSVTGFAPCTTDQTCYLYRSDGVNYKLIANCTPETPIAQNNPYYDPCRPTWAFQVSSSRVSRGTNGQNCNFSTNGW